MKKVSLIINPIAGERDNVKFARRIAHTLHKSGWNVEQLITERAGHAHDLAAEKAADNDSIIASMGGDGTINEIASSLVNTSATMAIIPCGSGNGLARMVGISGIINRVESYFNYGKMSPIDVGTLGNFNFFCTCGFGFDAMVAHSFSQSKARGLKTYIESTVQKAIEFKGLYAEFTLDGKPFSGEFMLVTIANANQYGNNAFIAPDAKLDDGWLDVTIIRKFPKIFAGAAAASLFTKQIDQFRFVETYRVKEMVITQLENPLFHRDGDHFTIDLPVKIGILPKALNLLQPTTNLIQEAELRIRQMELYELFLSKMKAPSNSPKGES
ncbi:MAG: diacylglycerol/lipid kinase family protein [Mangrovibacterium sp.]